MRKAYGRFLMLGTALTTLAFAASQISPARSLTHEELRVTRGGGGQASKCSESCDRLNNYADDCNTGGGSCQTCSKGSTTTNYLDQVPLCGAGGFKIDPNNSTDCGKIQNGTCTAIAVCTANVTTPTNCNDPQNVIAQ